MKTLIILIIFIYVSNLSADCRINGEGPNHRDLLAVVVSSSQKCPKSVQEFKQVLQSDGLKAQPAMVANRGFHNPEAGSFSIFESVSGFSQLMNFEIKPEDLYFGHFTAVDSSRNIVLDQHSTPNKLLIEAIAFDFESSMYNFYELVGTSSGPQWFFRGNTKDALSDNRWLKIGPKTQFGTKMRCSACHNSGGPIMKELHAPHNDWWTKSRGLIFAPNRPSPEVQKYVSEFIDASAFSRNVYAGMKLIEKSSLESSLTLKEQLRPLFCTTEINIRSDILPLAAPSSILEVSSEIFVDPLLAGVTKLAMNKNVYIKALQVLKSKFPETNYLDADHGFLAPTKGVANHLQINKLIANKVIDEEFALDVLSIDFRNPLFSKARCQLLKFVPEEKNWLVPFKAALLKSQLESALELGRKLEVLNSSEHREKAMDYLKQKEESWLIDQAVLKEIRELNILRMSVYRDDISQNPKGQILEPGFRIIFPEMQ